MEKRWRVAESCPPEFVQTIGPPIVAQLLWNRGIRERSEAEAFLSPSWEDNIHDALQFRQMEGAVVRVFDALEKGERITVHGDYDADGVTGSTLIITVLKELAKKTGSVAPIDYYIPHRDKEGYGLHRDTVPLLKERGTSLIITVDCGIACVDEIALAKVEGIDTIVVDHHQFGETVPDGHLIHPGLPEETYPFKHLAAVGVAYKFACALLSRARQKGLDFSEGWEKWLLDLVAIATVTDMVPLVGENRVLETYGLTVLNKTKRPGFLALFEMAGVEPGQITSETVGFAIGPRINAAGRMDHATVALRLLLSESMDEARLIARELEDLNKARQDATKKMMVEAEKIVGNDVKDNVIVVWKENWSPALVGLVAGRFMEKFSRPVIAVGKHGDHWIGSGRSISTYNITEAVKASGEGILTRSGGHVQACGFALNDGERLPEFKERLVAHSSAITDEELTPLLSIDAEMSLAAVSMDVAEGVKRLEPYGMGNPLPIFLSKRCKILSSDTMGSTGSHLRLQIADGSGRAVKAVGFKMGGRILEALMGREVDIVYNLSINEWNGRRTAECRLIDFRPCT
jgi:single-stranded-DNA-specific exonuclease